MKASVVQSLLARNRNEIRCEEHYLVVCKETAKDFFEMGFQEAACGWRKSVTQARKRIKKLVHIQKELKKELQVIYNKEAEQRFYDSM